MALLTRLRSPMVVLSAVLAAGCASLARQAFRTPTVELQDVKVRALGLEGGALDLVLDVYNPNEYRIDVTSLTYTLFADSSQVAAGAVTKRVTLNNRAHNGVTLPVSFTFKELLNVAQVMLKTGAVNYTVKGDVVVDSPFGSVTRPYEGKARVENGALLRP